LGLLRIGGYVCQSDQLHAGRGHGQDAAQFGELGVVAGGEQDPGHDANAARCRSASSWHPVSARSSNWSSSCRVKTADSPVPCTSTNSPVAVQTTFMSTLAATSSV